MTYTVVLVPAEEGGYTVLVPALPGCVTEGDTLGEALLMVEDAISGYLVVLREDGDPIPEETGPITVGPFEANEVILRRVTVKLPQEAHA